MAQSVEAMGEASRADRISYWLATTSRAGFGTLKEPAAADVVVVGAGVTGLTCAFLLAKAGRDVTVLEAGRVAAGVSGFTTAKLTAGHGLVYSYLERAFGQEAARTYAESQTDAVNLVRRVCEAEQIDCDLETQANFVHAESDDAFAKLERELAAAKRAGLIPTLETAAEVPVASRGALRLEGQAQFHVRKYLLALASLVTANGGRIFESSRVVEISGSGPYVVSTADGAVTANAVVCATHYPIVEQGFFSTRIHPRRSYVVAARLNDPPLEGMYINTGTPTRSFRTTPLQDGGRLLIVGGDGHRVGQEEDTDARYARLEDFMRANFSVGDTLYRWSTQDNYTVDRLPYVGRIDNSREIFVATGFGGWGMTNGTVAARVISDLVQGAVSPWASLYELQRRSITASARRFLTENTNVAVQQMARPLRARSRSVDELALGDGAVVSVNGERVAVSRALDGSLSGVSAQCTHMGCIVAWNRAESTWDCPCHGSRFAPDGRVLHGPAIHELKSVPLASAEAARA